METFIKINDLGDDTLFKKFRSVVCDYARDNGKKLVELFVNHIDYSTLLQDPDCRMLLDVNTHFDRSIEAKAPLAATLSGISIFLDKSVPNGFIKLKEDNKNGNVFDKWAKFISRDYSGYPTNYNTIF